MLKNRPFEAPPTEKRPDFNPLPSARRLQRRVTPASVAHYMLRWVNTKGEQGPWSQTVSATITG